MQLYFIVKLYHRSLWSLSTHMRISLSMIWFKDALSVYMDSLMTPHDHLTKKIEDLFFFGPLDCS